MIKWLKLPPQLFCFLIAKLSVWLRGEVAFDLLLLFVSGKGPSGAWLVSWHLNHRDARWITWLEWPVRKPVEFDSV